MAVNISDDHFSSVSSASRLLAEALRAVGNDHVAGRTTREFARFLEGLEEIIKTANPVREELLHLWHGRFIDRAESKLKPLFESHELPYAEYLNLLIHRVRRARELGTVMEKMR